MYSDDAGMLLMDDTEIQYFGYSLQYLTCNVNDLQSTIDKSVFIGFEGNVFEFVCKFIDECEDTVLTDLQTEVYDIEYGINYNVVKDMWDRTKAR